MGCHKNPTKELAYEAGRVGDLVRFLHGSSGRRNASLGGEYELPSMAAAAARASSPVSASERADAFRSPTGNEPSHMFEARSILTAFGPEWCGMHFESPACAVPLDAPPAPRPDSSAVVAAS